MLLRCALVLFALQTVLSVRVEDSLPIKCTGAWDVSQDSMYNIAFKWTHQQALEAWRYTALRQPGCVEVSYKTVIRLSNTFRAVVPSSVLRSRLTKQVCATGNVMNETLVLDDLLVINTLQINMLARIEEHMVFLVSTTEIEIPWFLDFLATIIEQQVANSLREYHNLLVESLCVSSQ
jgi:hypothetical protein